jgi:hypothetical protein
VHVKPRDIEHHDHRNDETTNIQLPLARLAKNDEDENCVDEVIGSSHAAMIGRRRLFVVGSGVEPQVDPPVNQRVDLADARPHPNTMRPYPRPRLNVLPHAPDPFPLS